MIETTTFITSNNTSVVTDWLMVIITFVYVIATIFICIANIKSANATREQLEESRKQFKETTRLNMLPFFEFDVAEFSIRGSNIPTFFILNNNGKFAVKREYIIRNIGLGTAKNIKYKCSNGSNHNEEWDTVSALKSNESKHIELIAETVKKENVKLFFTFCYQDLLENNYSQTLEIELPKLNEAMIIKVTQPKLETK